MRARRQQVYRLMRWHDSRDIPQDLWRIEQLVPTSTHVWITIETQVYRDKNRAIDRLEELCRPAETLRERAWRRLRDLWTGRASTRLDPWESL